MQDFIFWWSVVSTILSVILLGVSIWQIVEGRKQKERSNAQVKIWMQDAQGVAQGLGRIIRDNIDKRYTTTNDVCNAIWALHSSAFALYQSLFEERAVTEDEFKQQQKEFREEARKTMQQPNVQSDTGERAEEVKKSPSITKRRAGKS